MPGDESVSFGQTDIPLYSSLSITYDDLHVASSRNM